MSRTSSYAESYTAANSDESARLTELRGIEAATAPAPRRQLVETRTSGGKFDRRLAAAVAPPAAGLQLRFARPARAGGRGVRRLVAGDGRGCRPDSVPR